MTSLAGSAYGSGRSRTAFRTLKIAVFAPMPSASVTNPRHAVQRVEERAPAPALGVEHFLARRRQTVETPPAAAAALHPLARDQAAAFEAVERRIERGHVERDGAVRPLVDQLGD